MCTDRPDRQPDLGQINKEGRKRLEGSIRPVITPRVLGIGALSEQAKVHAKHGPRCCRCTGGKCVDRVTSQCLVGGRQDTFDMS